MITIYKEILDSKDVRPEQLEKLVYHITNDMKNLDTQLEILRMMKNRAEALLKLGES